MAVWIHTCPLDVQSPRTSVRSVSLWVIVDKCKRRDYELVITRGPVFRMTDLPLSGHVDSIAGQLACDHMHQGMLQLDGLSAGATAHRAHLSVVRAPSRDGQALVCPHWSHFLSAFLTTKAFFPSDLFSSPSQVRFANTRCDFRISFHIDKSFDTYHSFSVQLIHARVVQFLMTSRSYDRGPEHCCSYT